MNDIKDLLAQLDPNEPLLPLNENNNINTFLQIFSIVNGEDRVTARFLFSFYRKWSKERLNSRTFYSEVAKTIRYEDQYFRIDLDKFKVKKENWIYFSNKKKSKVKSNVNREHFDNFIRAHEISTGNVPVLYDYIFRLYDKWMNLKKKANILSYNDLKDIFKIYLKTKRTKHGVVFYMNETIWNHINKENYSEEKEKKPKKRRKIPSIKT